MPRQTRLLVVWLSVLSAGAALAGCGQKGNLYLPNQKNKVPANQPQSQAPSQPPSDPPASPNSGTH